MKRLTLDEWKIIFANMNDLSEDEIEEFGNWIEVIWLETDDEWILAYGYECFEDGFKTEIEAMNRLSELENLLL